MRFPVISIGRMFNQATYQPHSKQSIYNALEAMDLFASRKTKQKKANRCFTLLTIVNIASQS